MKTLLLAISLILTSVSLKAQQDSVYFKQGEDYYSKRDFNQALDYYTKAVNENQKYSLAYRNRARAYLKLQKYEDALNDLNVALTLNTKDPIAYNGRGMIYMRFKRYDEAISDFKLANQLDSLYSDAYNNIGAYYYEVKGDVKQALTYLLTAIRIGEKDNTVKDYFYSSLAVAYYDLAEYSKAIDAAGLAIKLNNKNKTAYEFRAKSYDKLGRYSEAQKDKEISKDLEKSQRYRTK